MIAILVLATCLYQAVESQQTIHWGRFLCGEVRSLFTLHYFYYFKMPRIVLLEFVGPIYKEGG